MNTSKSVLLLASLALCTWPMAATAQQGSPEVVTNSEVEVGVGGVTSDSFYFNEYTGITETDPYFFGNIELYQRAAYDSDSTRYVEFLGRDLGLPSQSLYIEAGRQGSFSVYGEYDAIPHLRFDDGQTPFAGAGSTELSLPPGWTQGADTALLSDLNASLQDLEVKTERERVGAGFSVNLNPNWKFSTSFRSEEKDGIDTIAGIFGTNGGNMRSAILPKPIDYTTQEAEMALGYSSDRLQANIRYNLSVFDNDNNSLTWENPYSSFNATFDGEGRLALEPNNSAHHLSVSAGYLVGDQTRLSGNLSLGRMLQNDDFLPYTVNPNLLVPTALPRDSLDGEVNTIHANLGVTTRLSQSTNLKAAYTYHDRDNKTPTDVFQIVENDSADQVPVTDDKARVNRPYSKQSHKVELEAGYRVTADTKLSVEYDFEAINRDLSEVEDTREHTVGAKVRSSLTETTSGSLSYAYATRTGSTYVSNLPFLESHSDDYLATIVLPDDSFEQNPNMRKFYMADRDRHLVKGGLTYFTNDRLVLGLNGSYNLSDYDALIGLTGSSYLSGTLDASYTPSDNVSLSGFFSYEQLKFEQTGYERGATAILPGDALDPLLFWDETSTENTYTAGVELAFTAIRDSLDIVVDYAYSHSNIGYDIVADAGLGVTPLPDLTADLHSIGIRADYQATDGITFRLGYRFETFEVEDFALAGVDEIISGAVFGLGNGEPDYDAHVVAASLAVVF